MILVFGSSGQVGRELRKILPNAHFSSRSDTDLSCVDACTETIYRVFPTAVINAAAYTSVDKAEEEETLARRINADAPAAMARACRDLGIPLVHISSDYVFDGSGNMPFFSSDKTDPLSAYGRSKLVGENAIRASGANHAILRTSWVFSSHGNNFVKTMLKVGPTDEKINVVSDQIGGPTPANSIARACVKIAAKLRDDPRLSGVYHFSGSPNVSWATFAESIFELAGIDVTVRKIVTSEYPTKAIRPLNSRLDCSNVSAFGLERPSWRLGVREVLADLGIHFEKT